MAEQLAHEGLCELEKEMKSMNVFYLYCLIFKAIIPEEAGTELAKQTKSQSAHAKEYYCSDCKELFHFTSVDILRHKQYHKRKEK